jgi:hypothetical protein
MRIARFTAILTIALGTFLPAHAHAATPATPLDVAPIQVVGGVAQGAINIADFVASCQHRPQGCVAGRPEA